MQRVALPGKNEGKTYLKVLHKVSNGERLLVGVLQQGAATSSFQSTAEAEKYAESESEDDEVEGMGKMKKTGGMEAVLPSGGEINSPMRNLEARQSKLGRRCLNVEEN